MFSGCTRRDFSISLIPLSSSPHTNLVIPLHTFDVDIDVDNDVDGHMDVDIDVVFEGCLMLMSSTKKTWLTCYCCCCIVAVLLPVKICSKGVAVNDVCVAVRVWQQAKPRHHCRKILDGWSVFSLLEMRHPKIELGKMGKRRMKTCNNSFFGWMNQSQMQKTNAFTHTHK